ncbi:MAG: HAD-IIIC family phosphatase [Kiritimatiellae bacterium]|nr:HAD-IIIC family phosphatase [Kiritimatiellia bacterium]
MLGPWRAWLSGASAPLGALLASARHAHWIDRARLGRRVVVSVARTWTVENLIPLLPVLGAFHGLDIVVRLRPFGMLRQEIVDPASPLHTEQWDYLVLLWQLEDFLPDLYMSWHWTPEQAGQKAATAVETIVELLRKAASGSAGTLIGFDFGLDPLAPRAALPDVACPRSPGYIRCDVNRRLHAALDPALRARVRLLCLDRLQYALGFSRWADERLRLTARCPFSAHAVIAVFREVVNAIVADAVVPRKVLLLDADNTLWGGILEEDGRAGIALSADYPGNAFVEIQKRILQFHLQGTLLGVCSKNDESELRAVFEKHPAMVLRPEHIAAWEVNWNPKSQSVRALAQRLNLALDAFVFMDDSPHERDEIRQRCPGVLVPDLPANPMDACAFWTAFNPFQTLSHSAEDRLRTQDYRHEEQRRRILESAVTLEDFYRTLGMRARTRTASEHDVARVAQMSQRTNQFNATTVRMTEPAVRGLLAAHDVAIHLLELSDRFGESGVVGCAVVREERDRIVIEQLMLSCRVLKRTAEYEFLSRILRHYATRAREALLRYVPSGRNGMVAELYESLAGGEQNGDGRLFRLPISAETIRELAQPWIGEL